MTTDDKLYNKGICKKCNNIYILEDKDFKSNLLYFSCKCPDKDSYYVFTKRKSYGLARFYLVNNKLRSFYKKIKDEGETVSQKTLDRVAQLRYERDLILNNKKNKSWRDKFYENIS